LNVHTFQPPIETAQERKVRRALARTLSPKSISTEDEIREEVSSVGMESSTLRPSYLNPFLAIPPPVIEDQEDIQTDSDPSTLTSPPDPAIQRGSTPLELKPSHSSNETAPSGRSRKSGKSGKSGKSEKSSIRSESRSEMMSRHERESGQKEIRYQAQSRKEKAGKEGGGSSSSSKKKKGIWNGFAKKIGMVKAIAKEIDAQRNNMPLSPGGGIGPMSPKQVAE
jgi:hypothetical protein